MIFAVEGAFLERLVKAGHEVVSLQVFWRDVCTPTEDAMLNAVNFYCAAIWATRPAFKSKVQRLFVPLPIIFRWEGVCAECTLEDAGAS